MLYQCKSCSQSQSRGFLPASASGLYMIFLFLVSGGLVVGAVRLLRTYLAYKHISLDMGSWGLIALPTAYGICMSIAFAGVLFLNYILHAIEYLAYRRRKCPACGASNWSFGFHKAFSPIGDLKEPPT